MIFTGIGAVLENMFFANAPEMLFSFIEGITADAMLTMIAETMLPEVYFKGGSIVTISTLLGFLVPIYLKQWNEEDNGSDPTMQTQVFRTASKTCP